MTGISVIPQKMHYDAALWMRRVQCFAYFYHSPKDHDFSCVP